ncbi:preprotein translocase subunit YajC [Herminiimonas sp. CN]|uniref:preprotein translocase subunit YajC n=1 Tax=Herminiimonas sp. CN TaxID=1349818 RepID=UPI0009DCEBAD|nr:preprotein translocase subunit YajC [Herminiimonas sp. CN]
MLKCLPVYNNPVEYVLFISNAFAQAGPAEALGLSSNLTSFLPIILMFAVMYFLMIRPQMKRQKEQKAMMAAIAKGDEVVTSGGMLGRVAKVTDAYVTLEIASGTEIVIQKAAIATLLPKGTIKSI